MTRVLLDQGLAPATAELLRGLGWDAVHVPSVAWTMPRDKQR